jgi:hypothetical protein
MFRRALITFLLPLSVFAQGSVAPDVESVISGGYWEDGAQSGRYRVVLVNSGYEHVTSRLRVEWVQDPQSAGASPEIVASSEPRLPFGQEVASMGARLTPVGKGRVRIMVTGVLSHETGKKFSAVLIATKPGHVAAVAANKSANADGLQAGTAHLQPPSYFQR